MGSRNIPHLYIYKKNSYENSKKINQRKCGNTESLTKNLFTKKTKYYFN